MKQSSIMNSALFYLQNYTVYLGGCKRLLADLLGYALAKEPCRQLHRVRYIRLPELLSEYADKSLIPGGKTKVLNKYAAFKVLVLDE